MVEGLSTGALLDVNTIYVCFFRDCQNFMQTFIM
jgi:hypothetical protein